MQKNYRFIPTRVGYTPIAPTMLSDEIGSSPLAWGILVTNYTGNKFERGSSPLAWGIRNIRNKRLYSHGSSPLAWGIRLGSTYNMFPLRFIPTRVGYTLSMFGIVMILIGSSPLAWGIRLGSTYNMFPLRFIPTRVGYTRRNRTGGIPEARFIPTRVGYTLWQIKLKPLVTVHPHSRGVYAIEISLCLVF